MWQRRSIPMRHRSFHFEDCCTIFVAKHPVTKPNLHIIQASEKKLSEKIDELVKTAIETTETVWVE